MGVAVAWGCVAGWLSQLTDRSRASGEYVQVTADGTPVIVKSDRKTLRTEYLTLERTPFSLAEPGNWPSPTSIALEASSTALRSSAKPIVLSFSDGQPSPTTWYFVSLADSSATGFFVGYDFNSRRRIGYIGRSGFQENEPAADRAFGIKQTSTVQNLFLAPQSWGSGRVVVSLSDTQPRSGKIPGWICHLVSDDRLIRIDLRKRTAETIFQRPQMLSVSAGTRPRKGAPINAGDSSAVYEDYLAVSTAGGVTVLDAAEHVETTYRLPAELKTKWFQFYLAADGKAVATYFVSNHLRNDISQSVIEFSHDGNITRKYSDVIASRLAGNTPDAAALFSFVVPEPIVPLLINFVLGPFLGVTDDGRLGYWASVAEMMTVYWPMLVLTTFFGIVSVWLYWRHALRFGNRLSAAWMAVIFLLGIPGYIGYRLHRHWPMRMLCASCGASVPRSRLACLSCGTEFPLPKPNGLEIFA
jgi:hypothetical protein